MMTIAQQKDIQKPIKEAYKIIAEKLTKLDQEQYTNDASQSIFINLSDTIQNHNNNLYQKYQWLNSAMTNITKIADIIAPWLNHPNSDYVKIKKDVDNAVQVELNKIKNI